MKEILIPLDVSDLNVKPSHVKAVQEETRIAIKIQSCNNDRFSDREDTCQCMVGQLGGGDTQLLSATPPCHLHHCQ